MARYLAAFPDLDPAAFAASYAASGAQRHTRILGTFTRLCRRDGKPGYLGFIPRVWRQLEAQLDHPALAPLAAWYARYLPPERRSVPPVQG
jgi:aminoglycoside/choline kinase family phosphotransferase